MDSAILSSLLNVVHLALKSIVTEVETTAISDAIIVLQHIQSLQSGSQAPVTSSQVVSAITSVTTDAPAA